MISKTKNTLSLHYEKSIENKMRIRSNFNSTYLSYCQVGFKTIFETNIVFLVEMKHKMCRVHGWYVKLSIDHSFYFHNDGRNMSTDSSKYLSTQQYHWLDIKTPSCLYSKRVLVSKRVNNYLCTPYFHSINYFQWIVIVSLKIYSLRSSALARVHWIFMYNIHAVVLEFSVLY